MKYQVLFSLKNNEEIFLNAICCNCDWRFTGLNNRNITLLSYLCTIYHGNEPLVVTCLFIALVDMN